MPASSKSPLFFSAGNRQIPEGHETVLDGTSLRLCRYRSIQERFPANRLRKEDSKRCDGLQKQVVDSVHTVI
ncbi:MAG: hypothetical protein ACM3PP_06070 [Candidatus Saccharibacteria bacterium]